MIGKKKEKSHNNRKTYRPTDQQGKTDRDRKSKIAQAPKIDKGSRIK